MSKEGLTGFPSRGSARPETLIAAAIGPLAAAIEGEFRIHSVHRLALYLEGSSGLVCVIAGELPDLPLGIRLKAGSPSRGFAELGFVPGDRGRVEAGLLRFGGSLPSLSFRGAQRLSREPFGFSRLASLDPGAFETALAFLEGRQVERSSSFRVRRLIFGGQGVAAVYEANLAGQLARRLEAEARNIAEAFFTEDPATVFGSARRMIGLGGGLTPAGDDYLAGLLGALDACGISPDESCAAALRVALQAAARATNAISAAFIGAALGACFPVDLVALAGALEEGSETRIGEALEKLERLGHSSGLDLATGFLHGLFVFSNHPKEGSADRAFPGIRRSEHVRHL